MPLFALTHEPESGCKCNSVIIVFLQTPETLFYYLLAFSGTDVSLPVFFSFFYR